MNIFVIRPKNIILTCDDKSGLEDCLEALDNQEKAQAINMAVYPSGNGIMLNLVLGDKEKSFQVVGDGFGL